MKVGEKYEIYWNDTFSFSGWYDDKELEAKTAEMDYLQRSCGIFAGEYKGWIILVTHENPHKSFSRWGHPDWIYRGTIKKIKKL